MNIRNHSTLKYWSPLFASLIALTSLSASQEDTVEENFATTGPGMLTLDLSSGSIDIDTYDGSEVKIAIKRTMKHGDSKDFQKELERMEITFEQSGNDIRCKLDYKTNNGISSWFGGQWHKLNFQAKVQIPKAFNVDANTSEGFVKLQNLSGNASLRTSGGSIIIGSVTGEVKARTSGGGIEAKECNGPVKMRTSGGSIRVNNIDGSFVGRTSGGKISIGDINGDANVSTSGGPINLGSVFGNLEANTSGGSINATLAGQPTGDCTLKTSGGSIRIKVDASANLEIDASTSGGGVNSNLTLSNLELKRLSLIGRLNNGGPTLKTRTSGGSITINSM